MIASFHYEGRLGPVRYFTMRGGWDPVRHFTISGGWGPVRYYTIRGGWGPVRYLTMRAGWGPVRYFTVRGGWGPALFCLACLHQERERPCFRSIDFASFYAILELIFYFSFYYYLIEIFNIYLLITSFRSLTHY